jgi:hypothetical protein
MQNYRIDNSQMKEKQEKPEKRKFRFPCYKNDITNIEASC